VSFSLDPSERYTFWTGITGGLFLALSYFGTDQSQVQRYLGGKNIEAGKMGLMFNAILKIPMQFFILLVGVMVFVFYQYYERPVHFNQVVVETISTSDRAEEGETITASFNTLQTEKEELMHASVEDNADRLREIEGQQVALSEDYGSLAKEINPEIESKDADYIFIRWILDNLPNGAIGLLLAVILSAAMSSTAGELNALATTTMNDFVRRLRGNRDEQSGDVLVSKGLTVLWGVLAIIFALLANLVDNLIELVNILGSLFYGTILGIFLCAFYLKKLGAREVFLAAVLAESLVMALFFTTEIGFLWYNVIGCFAVVLISYALKPVMRAPSS